MDELIIPKLIFFFILVTHLVDIVLILKGEILSWSLMGVKGLSALEGKGLRPNFFSGSFSAISRTAAKIAAKIALLDTRCRLSV